jgi:hypothetical protein
MGINNYHVNTTQQRITPYINQKYQKNNRRINNEKTLKQKFCFFIFIFETEKTEEKEEKGSKFFKLIHHF